MKQKCSTKGCKRTTDRGWTMCPNCFRKFLDNKLGDVK